MFDQKLNHTEPIIGTNQTIGDFWMWAYSNVLSLVNRSVLSEFLVASALDIIDKARVEWNAFDLCYRGKKIEVKSASYLQTWNLKGGTKIQFDIAKKRSWFADTNTYSKECIRCSDIYIFSLFTADDINNANPLDTNQWQFYILMTDFINHEFAEQKLLKHNQLTKYAQAIEYGRLKSEVDSIIGNPFS